MKTRSITILLGLVALTTISITAAMIQKNPSNDLKDLKTVKIGTFSNAIDYAPFYIAKNMGWFQDVATQHKATVEFIEFQSLPPVNESLATNNLDIIFEAETPAIVGKAAGIGLTIKELSSTLTQDVLVPLGSSINTVDDLKGTKIAVLAGTSSHYGIFKILEDNGLSKNDIEVVDMVPPDARAAFETGLVDAWAVWPPWVEQLEVAGLGRVIPGEDVFIQSIVAMNDRFEEDNPQLANELINVVRKAKQWIIENPEQSQSIIATDLNLPLEVVVKAWPRHDFTSSITSKEVADMQSKADFLLELGLIQNAVDVQKELISISQ